METRRYLMVIMPVLLLLASCASYDFTKDDIKGTYTQKEYKGIQLEFGESNFVMKDVYKQEHLPPYDCCDTIAVGSWEIEDRGLLSVSSPEESSTFFMNMDVVEEEASSKDTIYFSINNDIEEHYRATGNKRDVSYQLAITSNKSTFDSNIALKRYDSNTIAIPIVEGLKISQFELIIYIDCGIPLKNLETREVYTLPYDLRNPKANVFKVNIPQLDYGYLSYRRLNKDYIKIINKNKLLWDGKEYLKQ